MGRGGGGGNLQSENRQAYDKKYCSSFKSTFTENISRDATYLLLKSRKLHLPPSLSLFHILLCSV